MTCPSNRILGVELLAEAFLPVQTLTAGRELHPACRTVHPTIDKRPTDLRGLTLNGSFPHKKDRLRHCSAIRKNPAVVGECPTHICF